MEQLRTELRQQSVNWDSGQHVSMMAPGEIWRETLRRTLPGVCNVTTFSERDPVVVIWCSCFQIISPYSGKFSFLNSLHNALFIRFSSAIINFFTACILFHHNYQTHKYIICMPLTAAARTLGKLFSNPSCQKHTVDDTQIIFNIWANQ